MELLKQYIGNSSTRGVSAGGWPSPLVFRSTRPNLAIFDPRLSLFTLFSFSPRTHQRVYSSYWKKGNYALFVMLLFRPWYGSDIPDFLESTIAVNRGLLTEEVAWRLLYSEFLRWRSEDIEKVAGPYFRSDGSVPEEPSFNTWDWWACLIHSRLRTLRLCHAM